MMRVTVLVLGLAGIAAGCGGGTVGKPPVVRQSLDDAQMTAAVKSALLNDAQIGAEPIDVRVSQGVVSLTGMVRSAGDAQRAEQLARQVAGVKDVKSVLTVKP